MLNILTNATEHSLEVYLVFLDFPNAFEYVPYKRFIHKIEKYGISGQL